MSEAILVMIRSKRPITKHAFGAECLIAAGTLVTLALRLAGIRWRLGLPEFDEPSRDEIPRP